MKLVNLLFLIFLSSFAFADPVEVACPDVNAIKQGRLYSWLPEYIEGQELVSIEDFKKFQTHVATFEKARWDAYYLETAHCFYSGNDAVLGKIVLAMDAYEPLTTSKWQWITKNSAECNSSEAADCVFVASG